MKKLIVCCDGTWNTPDQHEGEILTPTNVLRLYNTILPSAGENIPQLKYYHPGVGTTGNGLLKLVDGGFALTLGEQVQSA